MVYRERIKHLRNFFQEAAIEALIVMQPENRFYLSGFNGSAGMLLFTQAAAYLLTDFRYHTQAQQQAPDYLVQKYEGNASSMVRTLLNEQGVKRLGFEGDNVTYQQYHDWQVKLSGTELVAVNGLVERLRQVKDAGELSYIRQAANLTDAAFTHILDMIKPGVTELELALELEHFMRRQGAEKIAFDTIVASGPRSAFPHGVPGKRKLIPGDLVMLDFGAVYAGYCSDLTRTVVLGPLDKKQREIYNVVREAQAQALVAIKEGVAAGAIDQVARQVISESGFGAYFGHSLGHGVGLAVHENPALARNQEVVLEAGMVVTVEPGVYLEGWGGIRIEDLVVVGQRNAEILSGAPKDLIVL